MAPLNLLIRIDLHKDVLSPPIWRTISVPPTATFKQLNLCIQIALGWACSHLYEFRVESPTPGGGEMRIVSPIINAPLVNHGGIITGGGLNHRDKADSADDAVISSEIVVNTVFGRRSSATPAVRYQYDMGSGWDHTLQVVGHEERTGWRVVEGEGHPAAEECGGVMAWMQLIKAYRTLTPTEREREKRRWYENECVNGDRRGLYGMRVSEWDMDHVNHELGRLG